MGKHEAPPQEEPGAQERQFEWDPQVALPVSEKGGHQEEDMTVIFMIADYFGAEKFTRGEFIQLANETEFTDAQPKNFRERLRGDFKDPVIQSFNRLIEAGIIGHNGDEYYLKSSA